MLTSPADHQQHRNSSTTCTPLCHIAIYTYSQPYTRHTGCLFPPHIANVTDKSPTRNAWQSPVYSPLGIAVSPLASSSKTQTCCHLVNVYELTRVLIDKLPISAIFFTQLQKLANVSPKLLRQTSPKLYTCSQIQCASKLPIAVPIFQSVLEWQCNKYPRKTLILLL